MTNSNKTSQNFRKILEIIILILSIFFILSSVLFLKNNYFEKLIISLFSSISTSVPIFKNIIIVNCANEYSKLIYLSRLIIIIGSVIIYLLLDKVTCKKYDWSIIFGRYSSKKDQIKYLRISLIILFLYLSPILILGENSHIIFSDNLDYYIPVLKVLAGSGKVFGSLNATIPNFMNGISRNLLPSELNFHLWLYMIFKPFAAYTINYFIIHVVAFFGMYLLLKRHFLKDEGESFIVVGVSLCFSLIPFFPSFGLSISGLPIALFAFLNIRDKKYSWTDWLIIFLIPFYSMLVLSFIFFIFFMFVLWLYDLIKTKKANLKFLIAIIFMLVVFVIVEYRLFYILFFVKNYVSSRTEIPPGGLINISFVESIKMGINYFINGDFEQNESFNKYFINFSVAFTIIIFIFKKLKEKKVKISFLLLIIIFISSIWQGLFHGQSLNFLKNLPSIIKTFNISRIGWLNPLFWYILFALSLYFIKKYIKQGRKIISISILGNKSKTVLHIGIVTIILLCQIIFLFYFNGELFERRRGKEEGLMKYKEFYSENLFKNISDYIGQDKKDYRIVSIGLPPGVTQYNGFYTLDGYFPNHPLSYKREFRKVIAKELDKSAELKYISYGSKFYIFVAELGQDVLVTKNENRSINNLDLNTEALKNMGGQYIFSAIPISNYKNNNLELLNIFDDSCSIWKIYLYKIK